MYLVGIRCKMRLNIWSKSCQYVSKISSHHHYHHRGTISQTKQSEIQPPISSCILLVHRFGIARPPRWPVRNLRSCDWASDARNEFLLHATGFQLRYRIRRCLTTPDTSNDTTPNSDTELQYQTLDEDLFIAHLSLSQLIEVRLAFEAHVASLLCLAARRKLASSPFPLVGSLYILWRRL